MDLKDLNGFYEAYMGVYDESKENEDNGANQEKVRKQHKKKKGVKESYDHYDLVLEYLLDEGFCDSQENAEAMMAHMSEEWVESIIDEAKEDESLSHREKWKKRNERLNMRQPQREARHKETRGQSGNYGINLDRYQPNRGSTRYPSIKRKGQEFTEK